MPDNIDGITSSFNIYGFNNMNKGPASTNTPAPVSNDIDSTQAKMAQFDVNTARAQVEAEVYKSMTKANPSVNTQTVAFQKAFDADVNNRIEMQRQAFETTQQAIQQSRQVIEEVSGLKAGAGSSNVLDTLASVNEGNERFDSEQMLRASQGRQEMGGFGSLVQYLGNPAAEEEERKRKERGGNPLDFNSDVSSGINTAMAIGQSGKSQDTKIETNVDLGESISNRRFEELRQQSRDRESARGDWYKNNPQKEGESGVDWNNRWKKEVYGLGPNEHITDDSDIELLQIQSSGMVRDGEALGVINPKNIRPNSLDSVFGKFKNSTTLDPENLPTSAPLPGSGGGGIFRNFINNRMNKDDNDFWKKSGLNLGLYQALSGVENAYKPAQLGESESPGQQTQQAVSSTLPLIGAVAGFVAAGPTGALAGMGAGSVAKSVVDDTLEGHIFGPKKAATEIGFSNANGSLDDFTRALQGATGNLKEIGDVAKSWGKSAPMGISGIVALGHESSVLGTAFEENANAFNKALGSSPLLYNIQAQLNKNGTPDNGFGGVAESIAATGNYEGALGALNVEKANARPKTIQENFQAKYEKINPQWLANLRSNIDSDVMKQFYGLHDPSMSAYQEVDFNKRARNLAEIVSTEKEAESQSLVGGTQLGLTNANVQLGLASGQGSTALFGNKDAAESAVGSLNAADKLQITNIRRALDNPDIKKNADAVRYDNMRIAQLQVSIKERTAAFQEQFGQGAAEMKVGEDLSGFAVGESKSGLAFNTGLYSGSNISDLSKLFSGRISAEQASAQGKLDASKNSVLSPQRRHELEAAGLEEQTEIAKQNYDWTQTVKTYNIQQAQVGMSAAQKGVQFAQLYGTPDQTADAIRQSGSAIADALAAVNDKLKSASTLEKPGLELEKLDLERQQQKIAYDVIQTGFTKIQIASQTGSAAAGLGEISGNVYGTSESTRNQYSTSYGEAKKARDAAQAIINNPNSSESVKAQAKEAFAQASQQMQGSLEGMANIIFTPEQSMAVTAAETNVGLLGIGFAKQGSLSYAEQVLGGAYDAQLQARKRQEQSVRERLIKEGRQDELPHFEDEWLKADSQLLLQKTSALYKSDMDWAHNLPSMMFGGSDNTVRMMPSPAQAGAYLEKYNPTAAVRNFGFSDHASGKTVTDQYHNLAVGASAKSANPGNLSLAGLADEIVKAFTNMTIKVEDVGHHKGKYGGATERFTTPKVNNTAGLGVLPGYGQGN